MLKKNHISLGGFRMMRCFSTEHNARRHIVLPFAKEEKVLLVAMADPLSCYEEDCLALFKTSSNRLVWSWRGLGRAYAKRRRTQHRSHDLGRRPLLSQLQLKCCCKRGRRSL